jgi:PadR family transcriptional regulator, regulatory protein AphA
MSNAASTLASGDYVFLAFLTWEPMSAYDIKKFMAVSVSNFWSAAHSQVYQQAKRLTRDGYIREQAVPGARRKRVLHLTAKGRRAVMHWLRQPGRPPQFYCESLVKLFFAGQAGDLEATKRALLYDRDGFVERLAAFEGLLPALKADPAERYPALTLDLGIRLHRMMIEWIDDTVVELEGDLEAERADAGVG